MAFDPDPDDEELNDDDHGTEDALDDEDGGQDVQDGAGDDEDDAEGEDSDPEEPRHHSAPQVGAGQVWEIILAERDEAGQWHTVGDPVPNASFPTMDLAFDYTTRLNCRDFGRKFDWANAPGRDWVAVRVGARRLLRDKTVALSRGVLVA